MLWYAMMLNQDRRDGFDAELNMTEYLASFINYEAVRQTKDSRENQKVVSDDDFSEQLRKMTGRDFDEGVLETATRMDTAQPTQEKEVKRKGSISIDDIKKYTGLDLDQIKFIPRK